MAATRRSKAEWRRLVDEWGFSGLEAEEFSTRRGLNPATLRWWRWRLESRGDAPKPEPRAPGFLELLVTEPEAPELVVELGAVRIRVPSGFDAEQLRRLVAALC